MTLRDLQSKATERIMATSIVASIIRGDVRRGHYVAYLSDVLAYARHSSQVIGLSATRLVLTHPALSQYLFHHALEELGHDKWVESDLAALGLSKSRIASLKPSKACLRMLGLEYFYAAHDNPIGLFGWMFVLESLGGRAAGGIADNIDRALNLQGEGLYFLRGHADADSHHSEDLFTIISEHITSEEDRAAFEAMASDSIDLYCDILETAYKNADERAHDRFVHA